MPNCAEPGIISRSATRSQSAYNNLRLTFSRKILRINRTHKIKKADVPFGIGGIGSFGTGLIPSPEQFIIEQYRLGSTATILSRSFCDVNKLSNIERIKEVLVKNVSTFRQLEKEIVSMNPQKFDDNYQTIKSEIADIVEKL